MILPIPRAVFSSVVAFGATFALWHPTVGAGLSAVALLALLIERIHELRAEISGRTLKATRRVADEAKSKIGALDEQVTDLQQRIIRLENRGR